MRVKWNRSLDGGISRHRPEGLESQEFDGIGNNNSEDIASSLKKSNVSIPPVTNHGTGFLRLFRIKRSTSRKSEDEQSVCSVSSSIAETRTFERRVSLPARLRRKTPAEHVPDIGASRNLKFPGISREKKKNLPEGVESASTSQKSLTFDGDGTVSVSGECSFNTGDNDSNTNSKELHNAWEVKISRFTNSECLVTSGASEPVQCDVSTTNSILTKSASLSECQPTDTAASRQSFPNFSQSIKSLTPVIDSTAEKSSIFDAAKCFFSRAKSLNKKYCVNHEKANSSLKRSVSVSESHATSSKSSPTLVNYSQCAISVPCDATNIQDCPDHVQNRSNSGHSPNKVVSKVNGFFSGFRVTGKQAETEVKLPCPFPDVTKKHSKLPRPISTRHDRPVSPGRDERTIQVSSSSHSLYDNHRLEDKEELSNSHDIENSVHAISNINGVVAEISNGSVHNEREGVSELCERRNKIFSSKTPLVEEGNDSEGQMCVPYQCENYDTLFSPTLCAEASDLSDPFVVIDGGPEIIREFQGCPNESIIKSASSINYLFENVSNNERNHNSVDNGPNTPSGSKCENFYSVSSYPQVRTRSPSANDFVLKLPPNVLISTCGESDNAKSSLTSKEDTRQVKPLHNDEFQNISCDYPFNCRYRSAHDECERFDTSHLTSRESGNEDANNSSSNVVCSLDENFLASWKDVNSRQDIHDLTSSASSFGKRFERSSNRGNDYSQATVDSALRDSVSHLKDYVSEEIRSERNVQNVTFSDVYVSSDLSIRNKDYSVLQNVPEEGGELLDFPNKEPVIPTNTFHAKEGANYDKGSTVLDCSSDDLFTTCDLQEQGNAVTYISTNENALPLGLNNGNCEQVRESIAECIKNDENHLSALDGVKKWGETGVFLRESVSLRLLNGNEWGTLTKETERNHGIVHKDSLGISATKEQVCFLDTLEQLESANVSEGGREKEISESIFHDECASDAEGQALSKKTGSLLTPRSIGELLDEQPCSTVNTNRVEEASNTGVLTGGKTESANCNVDSTCADSISSAAALETGDSLEFQQLGPQQTLQDMPLRESCAHNFPLDNSTVCENQCMETQASCCFKNIIERDVDKNFTLHNSCKSMFSALNTTQFRSGTGERDFLSAISLEKQKQCDLLQVNCNQPSNLGSSEGTNHHAVSGEQGLISVGINVPQSDCDQGDSSTSSLDNVLDADGYEIFVGELPKGEQLLERQSDGLPQSGTSKTSGEEEERVNDTCHDANKVCISNACCADKNLTPSPVVVDKSTVQTGKETFTGDSSDKLGAHEVTNVPNHKLEDDTKLRSSEKSHNSSSGIRGIVKEIRRPKIISLRGSNFPSRTRESNKKVGTAFAESNKYNRQKQTQTKYFASTIGHASNTNATKKVYHDTREKYHVSHEIISETPQREANNLLNVLPYSVSDDLLNIVSQDLCLGRSLNCIPCTESSKNSCAHCKISHRRTNLAKCKSEEIISKEFSPNASLPSLCASGIKKLPRKTTISSRGRESARHLKTSQLLSLRSSAINSSEAGFLEPDSLTDTSISIVVNQGQPGSQHEAAPLMGMKTSPEGVGQVRWPREATSAYLDLTCAARCSSSASRHAPRGRSRIPRKQSGGPRALVAPRPVRPPMWLSKAELSQEIQHLSTLCEARTKELNRLKMETRHVTSGFDALAVVIRYMSSELNAFKNPDLASDLKEAQEKLNKGKKDLEYYEKEIEKLNVLHVNEVNQISEKLTKEHESKMHELTQKHNTALLALKEEHRKEVESLTSALHASCEEEKEQHKKMIDDLQQELRKQREEMEIFHQHELDDLEERHLEKQKSLLLEVEKLQKQCEEAKRLSVTMEDALQKDTDSKLQWLTAKRLDLQNEVDSLKAVLEIKNNELHSLRKENLEMQKELEELPLAREKIKMLQARAEDLQALMAEKVRLERQLSTEHQSMKETYEREAKVNKRLSMENEELLWRLKQVNESSLLSTSVPDDCDTELPDCPDLSSSCPPAVFEEASSPVTPVKSPRPGSASRPVFFTYMNQEELKALSPQSPRTQYKRIQPHKSPAKPVSKSPSTRSPRRSTDSSPHCTEGTPRKMARHISKNLREINTRHRREGSVEDKTQNTSTETAVAESNMLAMPDSMMSSASSENSVFEPCLLEEQGEQIRASLEMFQEQRASDVSSLCYSSDSKWPMLQEGVDNVLQSSSGADHDCGEIIDPKTYYHMTFPVKESTQDIDVEDVPKEKLLDGMSLEQMEFPSENNSDTVLPVE